MASSKVQSPRDEATPAPLLTSPYGCVVALSIRFGAVVIFRMRVLNDISVRFVGSCGRTNAAKFLDAPTNLNLASAFAIALSPSQTPLDSAIDSKNLTTVEAVLVHPIVNSGLGDVMVMGVLGDRPRRSREQSLVVRTLRRGVDVERIVRSDPTSAIE